MTEITPNILKCIERLRERRPMTLDSVSTSLFGMSKRLSEFWSGKGSWRPSFEKLGNVSRSEASVSRRQWILSP
jgi:hypothetical protein